MDYCPGTPYQLQQDSRYFRMNTDTVLLGQFMASKAGDIVLDVGCNNGALMLYAALHPYRQLIGIDLDQTQIDLARHNLELNGIDRWQVKVCDFHDFADSVDVIVCNPPYFKASLRNPSAHLAQARHESALTMDDLLGQAAHCLRDHGRLFVVYPADRLAELLVKGEAHGFYSKRLALAYKKSKARAHVALVELRLNSQPGLVIESPIDVQ